MSDRERWIVYPLLLLALGAALRDKIVKQTQSNLVLCRTLVCQEFLIVDEDGRRMVAIGSDGTASSESADTPGDRVGQIEVYQTVGNAQFPIARIGAVTALPGMAEVEQRAASAAYQVFRGLLNTLQEEWNASRGDTEDGGPQAIPPETLPKPDARSRPAIPPAGQVESAGSTG